MKANIIHMKTAIIFRLIGLSLIFISASLFSQTRIFGTLSSGFEYTDIGGLYSFDENGSGYESYDVLSLNPGRRPHGDLIWAANGKMYGTGMEGGTSGLGVIFEYDPGSSIYTRKVNFTGSANGSYPYDGLVLASNGKMYGLTQSGGSNNNGTLYEYDPASNSLIKRHDFLFSSTGSNPRGKLCEANNGMLYGFTKTGGANSHGVIFRFDPSNNSVTKVVDLFFSAGTGPEGSFIKATNGKLYALLYAGGNNNQGTIVEFDPAGNNLSVLHSFSCSSDGCFPYGELFQASNGILYGLTYDGGTNSAGIIFSYNLSNSTFTNIGSLHSTNHGSQPQGGFIAGKDGKLYAMCETGGTNSLGTIISLDINNNSIAKVFDFNGTEYGASPRGNFIKGPGGDLYGLTYSGGASNKGVLFIYDVDFARNSKKIDFESKLNGSKFFHSLAAAPNGMLYGITEIEGANNHGTLVRFNPMTKTLTKVLDFNYNSTGGYGRNTMILASNGKFYGTIQYGGANGHGVLFSFDYNNNSFVILKSFNSSTTGRLPISKMVQAPNGKLYGTTSQGGTFDWGTIFEYDIVNDTLINCKSLAHSDGKIPTGDLIVNDSGLIIGTTILGGAFNDGTIFRFNPNNFNYSTVFSFNQSGTNSGRYPRGGVIQHPNGNYYGITSEGNGTNNFGTIYRIGPSWTSYTVIHTFSTSSQGRNNWGGILLANNGKFYSYASGGGNNNGGTFYEYDLSSSTFTVKHHFQSSSGWVPVFGSPVQVAINSWTGAKNTDWNDTANWSLKKVPGANDNAYIPSGLSNYPIISQNVTVLNILITNGASLTVSPSYFLSVKELLKNEGTIKLQDKSSLLPGSSDYLQLGDGNYEVTRISGNKLPTRYNFWSSPVNSATAASLPGALPDKKRFTPGGSTSSDFITISNTDLLEIGAGYTASGQPNDEITFTGKANNNAIYRQVASSGGGAIYNLLGNPYPSAINAEKFIDGNGGYLNRVLFLFSQISAPGNLTTNDYIAVNDLGTTSGLSLTRAQTLAGTNIGACQGFMVQAKNTGLVNFANAYRNSNNSNFYKNSVSGIWLDVTGPDNSFSETMIGMKEDAGDAIEDGYDAVRIISPKRVSIYSIAYNKPLAIQGIGFIDEEKYIPIGVQTNVGGTYMFSLGMEQLCEDYEIYLEDKLLNKFTSLRERDVKVVLNENQRIEGRFFLYLKNKSFIHSAPVHLSAKIFARNRYTISAELSGEHDLTGIEVFDLNGKRLVSQGSLSGRTLDYPIDALPAGIYIVKLHTSGGTFVEKILLN